jgi:drug/metabolite transporter (DMT)-like permease
MVALLSWLIFSEKITARIGLSLLCTYLGIVLLYSYESSNSSDTILLGTSLVALAALSFAFYVIFSKAYIQRFGSIFFTSVAMLSSTLFVLIHFFVGHQLSDLNVNAMTWLWAALLAIVSTLIPSFLVSEAILRIGATKTSIAGTLGPVFTVLLAVFILDEAFGWAHFFGMSLVVLGVFFLDAKRV